MYKYENTDQGKHGYFLIEQRKWQESEKKNTKKEKIREKAEKARNSEK